MQSVPRQQKVRTGEQLAKAAMRSQAISELSEAGLDTEATITVNYMGITHVVTAKPTVNLQSGQIMFHFGGRTTFEFESITLDGSVQGNLFTGQAIDPEMRKAIWDQYMLKESLKSVSTVVSREEELDRDEVTA